MVTVINNPGENSSTGAGVIIGIVVAIILVGVIFIYGLPALRGSANNSGTPSTNVNVTLPTGNGGNGGAAE